MKIISGGQTGVDRAALDVGLELGMEIGGYCPKGRIAEDGRIDDKYPLIETYEADYIPRTRMNIGDSDGTLILIQQPWDMDRGTQRTFEICKQYNKPVVVHFLDKVYYFSNQQTVLWILEWLQNISILNVAGPRESKSPGIYEAAKAFLLEILR
jgi:hypothetical protein